MPGIAMEDIAHFDGVTRFDLLNVGGRDNHSISKKKDNLKH